MQRIKGCITWALVLNSRDSVAHTALLRSTDMTVDIQKHKPLGFTRSQCNLQRDHR